MTVYIGIASRPDVGLEAHFHPDIAQQLVGYVVGFYESLFAGSEPRYPGSKAEFVYRVLKDGYGMQEGERSPQSETFLLTDSLPACRDLSSKHSLFHDQNAWRLMVSTFTTLL